MKEITPLDALKSPEDTSTPAQARWSETRELLQRALQEWDSSKPTEGTAVANKSPLASHPQPEKLGELFQQLQNKLKELSE